ncbi:MAG: hypothetical protein J5711_05765 [Bacteroidales bacterium]|nr:hypothetical protein [Bacteroidales bacterium]
MRKPVYDKDLVPEPSDTAVVMWGMSSETYTLAAGLNEVYGLNLTRDDDLMVNSSLQTVVCPCFTYTDAIRQMFYVLLGNPIFSGGLGGRMNYYNAILLINGDGAWDMQQRIYGDFYGMRPLPDPFDWRECERYEALRGIMGSVTHTDYFDFRDESAPRSSVYSNFSERAASKINSYFKELVTCLESVIWAIGDAPDIDML